MFLDFYINTWISEDLVLVILNLEIISRVSLGLKTKSVKSLDAVSFKVGCVIFLFESNDFCP